jgi:hypothetical protein
MIDMLVRSFLGGLGGKVLDFYQTNSLLINSLILLYALLLILSRRTYNQIITKLTADLMNSNIEVFRKKSVNGLNKMITRMELPWESTLSETWFPFLTPPGKLLPYLKNRVSATRFITPNLIAQRIHSQINKEELRTDHYEG